MTEKKQVNRAGMSYPFKPMINFKQSD